MRIKYKLINMHVSRGNASHSALLCLEALLPVNSNCGYYSRAATILLSVCTGVATTYLRAITIRRNTVFSLERFHWRDHLNYLQLHMIVIIEVICIHEVGLRLMSTKCRFAQWEIYLGYVVSCNSISPNSEN